MNVKKIESEPSAQLKESIAKVDDEKKGFFAKLFGAKKQDKQDKK